MERAFELARSGEYPDTGAIRRQLAKEGFADVAAQISGPSLTRQLREIIAGARRD